MDFVKKHYEKILLSVVLLGLVGVLVFMLYLIPSDQEKLATSRQSSISPHVKPLDRAGFGAGNECLGAAAIALQT